MLQKHSPSLRDTNILTLVKTLLRKIFSLVTPPSDFGPALQYEQSTWVSGASHPPWYPALLCGTGSQRCTISILFIYKTSMLPCKACLVAQLHAGLCSALQLPFSPSQSWDSTWACWKSAQRDHPHGTPLHMPPLTLFCPAAESCEPQLPLPAPPPSQVLQRLCSLSPPPPRCMMHPQSRGESNMWSSRHSHSRAASPWGERTALSEARKSPREQRGAYLGASHAKVTVHPTSYWGQGCWHTSLGKRKRLITTVFSETQQRTQNKKDVRGLNNNQLKCWHKRGVDGGRCFL